MEEKYTQQDFQISRKSYPFRGTIFWNIEPVWRF